MGISMGIVYMKRGHKVFLGAILLLLVCLGGCRTKHATHPTSIQNIKMVLDKDIQRNKNLGRSSYYSDSTSMRRSLMPSLSGYLYENNQRKRFDVVANQLPAREFFMGLVAGTSENIMIHPDV